MAEGNSLDLKEIRNYPILISTLLLLLIELIAAEIFPEIFDPFYVWFQSIVSYKLLLSLFLLTILITLYAYKSSRQSNITKDVPEKKCPSCGKPRLQVVNSTVRSFEYKCKNCGFVHKTLKEGQINTIKK